MKMQRLIGALCAGLLLISLPARAAEQSSYVTPVAGPMPMSTYVGTYLNPALRAIASCHNGSSAPANGPSGAALAYQCWVDTTANPALYKIYNGTSWITLGSINTSTHVWLPYLTGGTSGGVPYFSAANVMGTSAALAQYGFVVGGGAGAAPATIAACSNDQIAFGATAAAPLCRSVSGDLTFSAGVSAIGANKVLNSMLAAMAANTTKCNATAGAAVPTDCSASTMRTNLALVPGTDVQAFDADLAALAANSSNGIWARTGAGTGAVRTVTAPAAGITISNGDGVSGNPTLALANDLAALEGVSGSGFALRTGVDTWTLQGAIALGSQVGGTLPVANGGTGITSGTSGGVLCFTGTTTAASSALLAQYGVTYGGGAGVCPAATAAGINGQLFLGVTGGAPNWGTMSQDCTITNAGVMTCTRTNNVLFGTAATVNTGTSGATIPLLNGNNTFSGTTVHSGTVDKQSAFSLSGDISPSQLVANTNDWAPTGFSAASAVRFSTDASRNVTGLAGGADGRIIILHNVGSFTAILTNEDAASAAANRFLFGGDMTLAADTSVTLRYDATSSRWRAITSPGAGGGGGGTVTSAAIAAGAGIAVSGTCTITTSGTCTVAASLSSLTNVLAANTTMGVSPTYTTGPTVAQGTSGTWLATGSVVLNNTAAATAVACKLWDGTTVIASGFLHLPGANLRLAMALSGVLASPAGNIRISCTDLGGSANSRMSSNESGGGKDSIVSVVRIQ